MNEEILGLLGLTPEQIAQYRQQSAMAGLGSLGQALIQAGAPRQGPRRGTLAGIAQALPAYGAGQQASMDEVLQNLLRRKQAEQMVAEQQAKQRQQTALQNIMRGRSLEEQLRVEAFPGSAESVLFPQEEAYTLAPGQRRFKGTSEIAAVPPEVAQSQVYQDYLLATKDPIRPFTGSFTDYQVMLKRAGRTQVTATATAGPGRDLTPGQKKRDEKAAEDIFQWESGGGQDMVSQIAQLKPVIAALEAGEPITGIRTAIQPDLLLALTNPKAVGAREAVEEVVQRNLRVILGAQFTEKEGERLISRAFNTRLPPEENARRVRKLLKQMETAAEQKQAMADYFNQNGTLVGFQGKMPTVRDFENAMEGGGAAQPARTGVKRYNPATGRVE
ncbi:MAG: hypothetical protein FJ211_09780 [Ignavibacteria bacterium]|nr:hypothetical protein [Ignavibacteria bacterium]